MPVPKPKGGENQDAYIERCMSWAADEQSEMNQDQQLAMCFSTYREGKSAEMTKAELVKQLRFSVGWLKKLASK